MSFSQHLARISLEIGAIQINAQNPFTWASGYRMPIYNDNRLLLGNAEYRAQIAGSLKAVLESHHWPVDVIAGVATAGIPHATSLANLMGLPLIYVRPAPKSHGMKNQVEGILHSGQKVIMVEDLISTGGSAIQAVQAVREAGGQVAHCLAIFSYGFPEAERGFREAQCGLHTLLTLESLLRFAEEKGTLGPEERQIITSWAHNPFEWGKSRGF